MADGNSIPSTLIKFTELQLARELYWARRRALQSYMDERHRDLIDARTRLESVSSNSTKYQYTGSGAVDGKQRWERLVEGAQRTVDLLTYMHGQAVKALEQVEVESGDARAFEQVRDYIKEDLRAWGVSA